MVFDFARLDKILRASEAYLGTEGAVGFDKVLGAFHVIKKSSSVSDIYVDVAKHASSSKTVLRLSALIYLRHHPTNQQLLHPVI